MSRIAGKSHAHKLMRAGTVAGRQGILLFDHALPPLMIERLGLPVVKKEPPPAQKRLILSVLQKDGECGKGEIAEFVTMHPGLRMLRYRNYESSLWTNGVWKQSLGGVVIQGMRHQSGFERADIIAEEIYGARIAFAELCRSMGLREATAAERTEALMMGGEMTPAQMSFFKSASTAQAITPADLDALRKWAGQAGEYGIRHAWRRAAPTLVTVAALAHNLRFSSAPLLPDEDEFLKSFTGSGSSQINQAYLDYLKEVFSTDVRLADGLFRAIIAYIQDTAEPILYAARVSSEVDTLMDFSGIPRGQVLARLPQSPGFTRAHQECIPDHPDNDDAITSITMAVRMDGVQRLIDLDIAFDGVSGQGGASVASRIAKDTFEIASIAGWIRSPEDVRLIALLADLTIDVAKSRSNVFGMATTMVASYIEDGHFCGIHCGDSEYLVVRRGTAIMVSIPHGAGRIIWSGLGSGAKLIQINNSDTSFHPLRLQDGDVVLTFTDGIGDVVCLQHELPGIVARNLHNLPGLTAEVIALADSRKDRDLMYQPGCSCEPFEGKDDDMGFIPRLISMGGQKP